MRPGPAGRASTRAALPAVLLALAVGATAACGPSDLSDDPSTRASTEMSPEATKSGDGAERHDLDPLLRRIPALEGATAATWFSGTLGSPDAPGPSLYWIDAVVTLPAGTGDQLRDTLALTPAAAQPDVVDALLPAVPDGGLLTGADLDAAFSHEGWRTTAYLGSSGDEVVLVVVGE